MEKPITFLLSLFVGLSAMGQQNPREFLVEEGDTTYLMKQYVFCLYLGGPNRTQSTTEQDSIQAAHLSHIGSMVQTHGLQVAGPFGDDTEKRGILIFDLETTEEAERAMSKDPAVISGRLIYECHPWWAAKGSVLR